MSVTIKNICFKHVVGEYGVKSFGSSCGEGGRMGGVMIWICEPELIARRGFNGFYRHFLSALVEHAGRS